MRVADELRLEEQRAAVLRPQRERPVGGRERARVIAAAIAQPGDGDPDGGVLALQCKRLVELAPCPRPVLRVGGGTGLAEQPGESRAFAALRRGRRRLVSAQSAGREEQQRGERRTADPEQLGGARDIALAAGERMTDHPPVRRLARRLEVEHGGALLLGAGEVEVLGVDQLAVRHDDRALHPVLELAHIARPVVRVDRREGIGGEAGDRGVHLGGETLEEGLRQQHRIAVALGKAGDAHHDLGEAVEQVLAEGARADHLLEILVRRAHDPGVDRDRAPPADTLDGAFLKEAQQLDLEGQRDVAHFVEEQRTAMRTLDLALCGLDRAGEGALLVAEQLAFEQVLGDRRAIYRDERPVGAVARLVQALGEQFLARPARAEQHHRDRGARHPLDGARHLHHLGRAGDQAAEHGLLGTGRGDEPAVLLLDLVQRESAPHDQPERVDIERLLVEVVGAALDRLQRALACAVAAGDDHLGVGLQFHDRVEDGEAFGGAVGVGRQAEIERDHRRRLGAQGGNRAVAVARDHDGEVVIGPLELRLQPGIVLDDEQGRFLLGHHATFAGSSVAGPLEASRRNVSGAGRITAKRLPTPSRDSTVSRPPIARIISRAS